MIIHDSRLAFPTLLLSIKLASHNYERQRREGAWYTQGEITDKSQGGQNIAIQLPKDSPGHLGLGLHGIRRHCGEDEKDKDTGWLDMLAIYIVIRGGVVWDMQRWDSLSPSDLAESQVEWSGDRLPLGAWNLNTTPSCFFPRCTLRFLSLLFRKAGQSTSVSSRSSSYLQLLTSRLYSTNWPAILLQLRDSGINLYSSNRPRSIPTEQKERQASSKNSNPWNRLVTRNDHTGQCILFSQA